MCKFLAPLLLLKKIALRKADWYLTYEHLKQIPSSYLFLICSARKSRKSGEFGLKISLFISIIKVDGQEIEFENKLIFDHQNCKKRICWEKIILKGTELENRIIYKTSKCI